MKEYLTKEDINSVCISPKISGSTTVTGTMSDESAKTLFAYSIEKRLISRAIYNFSLDKMEFSTCLWILYPIYRIGVHVLRAKYRLYYYLNK